MEDLPQDSVEKLARVTRLLKTQRTLPARLEALVAIVKRTVPHCDAVGVSLVIAGEPASVAVSDRLAVEIDLVQYQTGEGPCLAAITDSQVIRIDLLERDSRFTRFAPGALDQDISSILSTPLAVEGRTVGALNMYSRLPDAFGAAAEDAVRPMADYAAEVIATSPLYAYSLDMVEGLMETLETKALIGQATGVIMGTEQLTDADALERLRDLALRSGDSLRAVATRVLEERPTGPLPAVIDPLPVTDEF
ncbi:MAG TPA: GAF and ANTAR domain-containing protein [Acidimicrobiales bacterium]|nr:GAF and ANTAR domain-containing protein [Acidimicrobiales bacterium]